MSCSEGKLDKLDGNMNLGVQIYVSSLTAKKSNCCILGHCGKVGTSVRRIPPSQPRNLGKLQRLMPMLQFILLENMPFSAYQKANFTHSSRSNL